jgi:hypothetical protein
VAATEADDAETLLLDMLLAALLDTLLPMLLPAEERAAHCWAWIVKAAACSSGEQVLAIQLPAALWNAVLVQRQVKSVRVQPAEAAAVVEQLRIQGGMLGTVSEGAGAVAVVVDDWATAIAARERAARTLKRIVD